MIPIPLRLRSKSDVQYEFRTVQDSLKNPTLRLYRRTFLLFYRRVLRNCFLAIFRSGPIIGPSTFGGPRTTNY
jgi:hypothetical protein